jgi:hypothetical protein
MSSWANEPAPRRTLLRISLVLALSAGSASAVEHPFILWTREEAASIRRTIDTEAWASNAYQRLCAEKERLLPLGQFFATGASSSAFALAASGLWG